MSTVSPQIQKDRKVFFGTAGTVRLTDTYLGWANLLRGLKARNADDPWAKRSITLIERTLGNIEDEDRQIISGDITIEVNATTATVLCHRGVLSANGLRVWEGKPMKPAEMRERFDSFEDYLNEVL